MEHQPENIRSVSPLNVPVERRLPSGRNKIERISDHSKGLVGDLKEWVELKIESVKLEVQHELEVKKNELIVVAVAGIISLVGALFLLVALAHGLGAWLGHPAWGFLAVAVLLFAAAGFYYSRMGPAHLRKAAEVMVEAANPDPKDEKKDPEAKRKEMKKV